MAQDDFDIDRLAAYLHMMPAQVSRLEEIFPTGVCDYAA